MELRQLEYFVHIAETGSFTRAAARANVAQPGVSAQVRRLEREVGEPLFDRTHRAVTLTDAGAALLPYARAALAAVADGRGAVDEVRGLVRGRVRIGLMANLPPLDVAGLLAGFRDRHPQVQLSLADGRSSDLVDRLRSGELDAALIGLPGGPPEGIECRTVHTEPLVVATSPADPLASRSTASLGDLRGRQLISLPRGSGLRAFLDDACAAAGFAPDIAIEASDPQLLADLTARGLGISVLPGSIAAAHADRLHLLTTARPGLRGRVALAWRAAGPHSPAARRLVSAALERLGRAG